MNYPTFVIFYLTSCMQLQMRVEEETVFNDKLNMYYSYSMNHNDIVALDNTHWQRIEQISIENRSFRVVVIFYVMDILHCCYIICNVILFFPVLVPNEVGNNVFD